MQFGGSLPKDDSLLRVSDFAYPRVIQALNPVRKKLTSNPSALAITVIAPWIRNGVGTEGLQAMQSGARGATEPENVITYQVPGLSLTVYG
ncbi:uncharacterized protein N7446_012970 [Penicillium canescens]|uniref:Uncharacterized protein n=1 Tax=Penicillium canescens TaxID=5083 RepID=A0AAD6HY59_PENCN|nr:uncharacterized protein N7446_012970 [Penicillium canescens]KAJ6022619.1 hypothetical protein N7460_013014 [Penicillium canescens]KAJ6026119.1 hypothetical protein N7444_013798 [Penicillium canescens]KAJ6041904.1 hypothetical protein N7446_012970 [Penicillium canescens]